MDCVVAGMTMATTRYLFGDDFTVSDYEMVGASSMNTLSLSIASEVNRTIEEWGCLIPAFEVSSESPTTIGLGDTFVGGFLLRLSKEIAQSIVESGK